MKHNLNFQLGSGTGSTNRKVCEDNSIRKLYWPTHLNFFMCKSNKMTSCTHFISLFKTYVVQKNYNTWVFLVVVFFFREIDSAGYGP